MRTIGGAFISLRYKITVKGMEAIAHNKSLLFLANHPSALDPVVLLYALEARFHPRPLAVETMYELPVVHSLMRAFNAIVIPDFDRGGNEYSKMLAKRALHNVAVALRHGHNVLLYPSGTLQKTGLEDLRAASGAFEIVNESHPHIVLVRTTGLWGSRFSCAFGGTSKDLLKNLLKAAGMIACNLFFFSPRRHVLVELEMAPKSLYQTTDKQEFNTIIQDWINRPFGPEGEVPQLVRESIWSKKVPQIPVREVKDLGNIDHVSAEVRAKVTQEIARIAKKSVEQVKIESDLARDLGFDSLDTVELIAYLDDELHVKEAEPAELRTVHDVFVVVGRRPKETHARVEPGFKKEKRHPLALLEGETIPEVFFRNCALRGNEIAAADMLSERILTYKQCARAVRALADRFRYMRGDHIGVMLPATPAAYLVTIALMVAGKIPVMLNWTLGHRHLIDAVHASHVTKILTSKKFVRAARVMDLVGVDHMLRFLEDLDIDWSSKIKALFPASCSRVEETACILFTSGSEAKPKGVPLTHTNILENLRAALPLVDLHTDDVLLGFLPPFHSFGFSVTGMLPLLTGFKVVWAADPTDGVKLAQAVDRYHVTGLCGAPTFLRGLLSHMDGGKSVRLIVTGAEKTPQSLISLARRKTPQAEMIEGYGITECSPILTINRQGQAMRGVGWPLPGVEIVIADLELKRLLRIGDEGIVLAAGPNVFAGYLDPSKNPFAIIEGKRWYVTGDLGHLDETGALWLSGRLKRFVKIGAEMVNLPAIEDLLVEAIGEAEQPYLAVVAKHNEVRPELVLFTTRALELDQVNNILRAKGLSALAKISQVIHIKELPFLGTGKVHFRSLEEQIAH